MHTTKLLSLPAFAKSCGISVQLAHRLVKRGDIPSVQLGTRRRVDARWMTRWVHTGQQPQADAEEAKTVSA